MAKALASFNLPAHVGSGQNHNRRSLSHRPVKVTTMSMSMSYKKSYWVSIHEDIESYLKHAVVVKEPVEVYEPMSHYVFATPVNMASALCVGACELVGGHREQAMAAAAALHLMHAASFVHENLPLSDRPSLVPNPKPMLNHHAFNPNIELLTGDGMIPFGLELLANSDDPDQNNSDRVLRVMIEMTRAFGSQGIIKRQYNELQQYRAYNNNDKELNRTFKKNEGELHACGAACGAILGGGSEDEIELLRRCGFYVGMIQGVSERLGPTKEVEELKSLAIKEVKSFNGEKIEAISSLLVQDNFNLV